MTNEQDRRAIESVNACLDAEARAMAARVASEESGAECHNCVAFAADVFCSSECEAEYASWKADRV